MAAFVRGEWLCRVRLPEHMAILAGGGTAASSSAANFSLEVTRRSDKCRFQVAQEVDASSPCIAALRRIITETKPDGSSFPTEFRMDIAAAGSDAVTVKLLEVAASGRAFAFDDGVFTLARVPGADVGGDGSGVSDVYIAGLETSVMDLTSRVSALTSETATLRATVATLESRVAALAAAAATPAPAAGCGPECEARHAAAAARVAELSTHLDALSANVERLQVAAAAAASSRASSPDSDAGGGGGGRVFGPGEKVRVRADVVDPKYGWGSLPRGYRGIGTVLRIRGDVTDVDFSPFHSDWSSAASELEPASEAPAAAFSVGDRVRLRVGVTPQYGWGSVPVGHRGLGTVRAVRGDAAIDVDWDDSQQDWTAHPSELEAAAATNPAVGFSVGDRVRLRSGLTEVTYGWGGVPVGYRGTGTVIRVRGDVLDVSFPPHQLDWSADPAQLEHAFSVGDRVRLRPGLTSVRFGWGSVPVGHRGVGTIRTVTDDYVNVDWDGSQQAWSANPPELERA